MFWNARIHQSRVNPTGGQAGVVPELNEYTKIRAIGT